MKLASLEVVRSKVSKRKGTKPVTLYAADRGQVDMDRLYNVYIIDQGGLLMVVPLEEIREHRSIPHWVAGSFGDLKATVTEALGLKASETSWTAL